MPKGVRNAVLHDAAYLFHLYWVRQLALSEIATLAGCADASNVRRALMRAGIPTRTQKESWQVPRHRARFSASRRGMFAGDRNPNWNGGVTEVNGYRVVLRPDHPHAGRNGYVYEHRLVMEEHLGRYLTSEEVVHHINRCKTDNRIENLMLCANQAEHVRIHAEEDRAQSFASKGSALGTRTRKASWRSVRK